MKIHSIHKSITSLLLCGFLAACASSSNQLDMAALEGAEIFNFRAPEEKVLSSGQPTVSQLGIAARSGVKHVINLRAPGEQDEFDEAEVVESLGMEYYSIPVAGGAGVTPENAASLQALLERFEGEPVLVHCASGNRVGGLMALSAFADGANADSAIAEGQRWGLTSENLEAAVRRNISNN